MDFKVRLNELTAEREIRFLLCGIWECAVFKIYWSHTLRQKEVMI